jgi:hypothetical protein
VSDEQKKKDDDDKFTWHPEDVEVIKPNDPRYDALNNE